MTKELSTKFPWTFVTFLPLPGEGPTSQNLQQIDWRKVTEP